MRPQGYQLPLLIALWLVTSPAVVPLHAQSPAPSPTQPDTTQPHQVQWAAHPLQSFVQQGHSTAPRAMAAERWHTWQYRKLNINTATFATLMGTHLLSAPQARAILQYRQDYGHLLSLYELQTVPGIDLPTLKVLQTYFEARPVEKSRRWLPQPKRPWQGYVLGRVGYQQTQASHLGAPLHSQLRLRLHQDHRYHLGLTLAQDAGEPWPRQQQGTRQYLPDYISGYYAYQGQGTVKQIVLGDYRVRMGQGLLWGPMHGADRGPEPVQTAFWAGPVLRPHQGAAEQDFIRGAATTLQQGPYTLTLFAGTSPWDAALAPTQVLPTPNVPLHSPAPTLGIENLRYTGLHRTMGEVQGRHQVHESTFGGALAWQHQGRQLGLGLSHNRFSHPFLAQPLVTRPHNPAQKQWAATAWGHWPLGPGLLFGEAVLQDHGGTALLGGLLLPLAPGLETVLMLRHYGQQYAPWHGHAFGAQSQVRAERGSYWGWAAHWGRWRITGYVDAYGYLWPGGSRATPGQALATLVRIRRQMRPHWQLYAQYTYRQRPENLPAALTETLLPNGTQIALARTGHRHEWRAVSQWSLPGTWQWQCLAQGSRHHFAHTLPSTPSFGFVLSQRLQKKWRQWQFSAQWALHSTRQQANIKYLHEPQLHFAYAWHPYSGHGQRLVYKVQYKPTPQLNLGLRGAHSLKNTNSNPNTPQRQLSLTLQCLYKLKPI